MGPWPGVEGNEIADPDPEPFFGYNNTKYKQILDEWMLRRQKAHFETLPPNSLARRFMSYSSNRTQELLTLTKSELKTITGTYPFWAQWPQLPYAPDRQKP
jgi:hypothetical protein